MAREDDYFSTLLMQQATGAEMVSRHPLLLAADAHNSEGLPPTIRQCFTHAIGNGPLTEEKGMKFYSVSGLLSNVVGYVLVQAIQDNTITTSLCVQSCDRR